MNNKIFLVSNYDYSGHPSEHLLNLAFWRALKGRYENTIVITKSAGKFCSSVVDGIQYVQIPAKFGPLEFIYNLSHWLDKQPSPQLICASDPAISPFPAGRFAKKRNIPFLMELQSNFFGKINNLEVKQVMARKLAKIWTANATAIRVCCELHKQALLSQGVDSSIVFRIPTRADCDLFDPSKFDKFSSRSKLGISTNINQIIILAIGNLIEAKSLHTAIKAMTKVDSNAKLVIVGEGYLKEKLVALVKDLKLEDRIVWLPRVSHNQIPMIMSAADVFVMPSRNEGMPRVVNEAQAMGLPVVASNIDGIPEQVINSKTGFLIEVEDWLALARHINLLTNDASLRSQMGRDAREHVLSHFDFNTVMLKWFDLIDSLIRK